MTDTSNRGDGGARPTASSDATQTASTATSSGITVTECSKRYGRTNALDHMTATFEQGKIHGLLGRNGAGKTTLMSIVCNHSFKTSGTVLIDGADPTENAEILGRTCFIHENQRWHDVYTVGMILASARRFYPTWDEQQAQTLVQRFELPRATRAQKMSRGQRSALAVIIGLSSHAEYTFLDEPYLGLDATARGIFYEALAVTQAEDPRTFIMSTHLIDECAALLETVTILHQGHVVIASSVEDALATAWCFTGMKSQAHQALSGMDILSESSIGAMYSIIFRGTPNAGQAAALRSGGSGELRHATLQELVSAIGAVEPQADMRLGSTANKAAEPTPEPTANSTANLQGASL
ncbi:ATP-binding cassette domain-containing protein [Bifidobacterium subtile]|uniref:Putative ABC transporter ATP-binding protein n=1 Tax=Bifidobacterium subtile TaxID=77635 RepID=A0A087E200_9BIFI|nr:ABC transporter ATP-binding protein [Bifidobacterium subtile]KFJ01801.1 putative ABC transporter ATP-binding protein [Bifidobacterium subtile]QOL37267.1 ABC transporter ATP-binding protein [Bifidobacterium subtile]